MTCPYCNKDTISFSKIYLWPYGTKKCPNCNNYSRVKSNILLSFISFILGVIWIAVPLILLKNPWYLIPSTLIIFSIDYFMDKKYRYLIVL